MTFTVASYTTNEQDMDIDFQLTILRTGDATTSFTLLPGFESITAVGKV